MTITAKITSISLSCYGENASGSFVLYCSDGTTMTIPLTPESAEKLMKVGLDEFVKKQQQMAQALSDIKPVALLGYDESKTIDDENPF